MFSHLDFLCLSFLPFSSFPFPYYSCPMLLSHKGPAWICFTLPSPVSDNPSFLLCFPTWNSFPFRLFASWEKICKYLVITPPPHLPPYHLLQIHIKGEFVHFSHWIIPHIFHLFQRWQSSLGKWNDKEALLPHGNLCCVRGCADEWAFVFSTQEDKYNQTLKMEVLRKLWGSLSRAVDIQ